MNKPLTIIFTKLPLRISIVVIAIVLIPLCQSAFAVTNGKIAFASNRSGIYQIYTMNPDGSSQTLLTSGLTPKNHPSYSLDGRRIAFDCGGNICTINADGSGQTQITASGTDSYPSFSPDGARIVFASERDGTREVYIMNADGTGQTRLTTNSGITGGAAPSFLPGGTRIGFVTYTTTGGISEMNTDGTALAALSLPGLNSALFGLAYSPDGAKIATSAFHCCGVPHIVVVNADGSGVTDVFFGLLASAYTNPDYSPDGTMIVLDGYPHSANARDIIVGNADGSGEINLTNSPLFEDEYPSWGGALQQFDFTGFLDPIDNPPASNKVHAGQPIPVAFSLNGDQGLNVLAPGYPISQQIDCNTGTPISSPEATAGVGGSGLFYFGSGFDRYYYFWDTNKNWKRTCRRLTLKFTDLSQHSADFQFK